MRVLGVDLTYRSGKNSDILSVCIVEGDGKVNNVIGVNSAECGNENTDKIIDSIVELFFGTGCDYIAIDSVISAPISEKLVYRLGEKVRSEFINADKLHEIVIMLDDNKILKRVGIDIKPMCVGNKLRFDSDKYEDMELSIAMAVGMANRIINKELNR